MQTESGPRLPLAPSTSFGTSSGSSLAASYSLIPPSPGGKLNAEEVAHVNRLLPRGFTKLKTFKEDDPKGKPYILILVRE